MKVFKSIFLVVFYCLVLSLLACAKETICLVENNESKMCIVVDSGYYPLKEDRKNPWSTLERTIGNISSELADYVEKITSARPAVVDTSKDTPAANCILVHIGRSEYVDLQLGKEFDSLDKCGYIIRTVDSNNIVIAGRSSEGTEFGTYEFIERFLGVRWLFPGPDGEYVPKGTKLEIPASVNIVDNPAFKQFPAIAHHNDYHKVWARRMRFDYPIKFHHSMNALFPPLTYKEKMPGIFPVREKGGERYLPPTNHAQSWQPCFTAPGIVDEAADNIIKHLKKYPEPMSYSFGLNDGGGYCQCPRCLEAQETLGNFSDVYYTFCNAVAERVLKEFPDAWFGNLAYIELRKAPKTVKIHPRIVPFLTYDTMLTLDDGYREMHEQRLKKYLEKASFMGRYDYMYGQNFVPPRIYIHHWADYVRWAKDNNIIAWYSETYPFFGSGPKSYITAKIWWNPDRDVDELLDEWCTLAFGKAAAPMKKYFLHWEDYWTRKVPKLNIFKTYTKSQYCFPNMGHLAALTSEDIIYADNLVEQAIVLADSPENKKRVETFALSWKYYRAVMSGYLQRQKIAEISSEELFKVFEKTNTSSQKSIIDIKDEINDNPALVFSWYLTTFDGLSRNVIYDIAEKFLDKPGDASQASVFRESMKKITEHSNPEVVSVAKTILAIKSGKAHNLVSNYDFEAENPLKDWNSANHHGVRGIVKASQEEAFSGKNSISIYRVSDGSAGIYRNYNIPVKPGKKYFLILKAKQVGVPLDAACVMITEMVGQHEGEWLNKLAFNYFKPGDLWESHVLVTPRAPEKAKTLSIRIDASNQPEENHKVYIDDFCAYELVE